MQQRSLVDLCAAYLVAHPEQKLDARQLAEAVYETNSAHFAGKKASYEKKNPDRSVIFQLEREIYARRQILVERHPTISIDASDKIRFFSTPDRPALRNNIETEQQTIDRPKAGVPSVTDDELREADLYPVIQSFLFDVEGIVTKRINESTSSNRRGRNGNKWLHPDIVGMHVTGAEWSDAVKQCSSHLHSTKARIVAVEVKRTITGSDLRQHFFQAVSNSRWANRAYLAAVEVLGEHTWRELQMLCALHGIGYIRIDPDDAGGGRIAIPALEREEVDWASANRIAEENRDFREFLNLVLNYLKTGEMLPQLWK
jgi:hypothetical protein